MFIVLEGIDGAGKSTQIDALAKWLETLPSSNGSCHQVVRCADPGTTAAGTAIRNLLLNQTSTQIDPVAELMLFFAARAQLVSEIIAPALTSGKTVISDRFLVSSVVYQGHLGDIPPEKIWDQSQLVLQDCMPDLILVLDLPAKVAAGRGDGKEDRIESRGTDYLQKVGDAFRREAAGRPNLLKLVNATQSPEDVFSDIQKEVQAFLSKGQ